MGTILSFFKKITTLECHSTGWTWTKLRAFLETHDSQTIVLAKTNDYCVLALILESERQKLMEC